MARRCCRDTGGPGDGLVLQQNEELPPPASPGLNSTKVEVTASDGTAVVAEWPDVTEGEVLPQK